MRNNKIDMQPCDIGGALTLSSESSDISVRAEGDQITVDLPQSFDEQLFGMSAAASVHHELIRMVHDVCETMDIKIVVAMSGRQIAVLGRGSHPGFISKSMSIDPVQVRLLPLLASLLDGKSAKINRRLHGNG